MLNEKLSEELCQSILTNKMSFEHLMAFLNNYPDIKEFLTHNSFKIPFIFNDSPLSQYVIASPEESGFNVINKKLSSKQMEVVLEIPCLHYLLLQFKEHTSVNSLIELFNIEPFKLSYLYKNNKKYSLFGFNLYNLLDLKIEDKNAQHFPIVANNKEEFFNFYQEKINNNGYISVYCDSLFPLFDFKLNIEDLIYENNLFTLEGRTVFIYLLGHKIKAYFKNINEFNHHEKIPLDNLIQYKIKNHQIDCDFSVSSFFDLLVIKNYFLKSPIHYQFCLMLLEKTPEIFTSEIMALICLKNLDLHDLLLKNFSILHPSIQSPQYNLSTYPINKEIIMSNYYSTINEINAIVEKFTTSDIAVTQAWNKLKIHLETINQPNGLDFLAENVEEKITFENIMGKYIPSILNNYVSIPLHLRTKEDSSFISMTLNQFSSIQQELEKIEMAVLDENIKKMKVFGKFLNTRLNNNTDNIVNLI